VDVVGFLLERLRLQVQRFRHSQRPRRHAGLYVTPAVRDRSDEQISRWPHPAPRMLRPQQGPPGCPCFWRSRCPGRMSVYSV
jgi:hypothetical protein